MARRRRAGSLLFWLVLSGAVLGGAVLSCNSNNDGAADNFDQGTQALKLFPAPGGLCEGAGADKECEAPGGCMSSDSNAQGQSAAQTQGTPANPANAAPVGYADEGSADYESDLFIEEDEGVGDPGEPMPAASMLPPDPPVEPLMSLDAGSVDAGPMDAGFTAVSSDAGTGLADAGADAGTSANRDAATQFGQLGSALELACSPLDKKTAATLYMSADDSNSMASPAIVRRLITLGAQVPASVVRPYEFLNYYNFEFEPAEAKRVRLIPQLSSCPVNGELNLQVALQSEARDPDNRRPLNVTFVLDNSGSMEGQPMVLQRAAVHAMASQMREGDIVSMVTWNTEQRTNLSGHVITQPNDPVLLSAVDSLVAGGGTDLHGGLVAGYQLAEVHRARERINRVVVVSDGIANVGITDEQMIGDYANDEEGDAGIYLSGIGVGDGVNDTLMDTVTDAGRGAYIYLDSEAEAQKMLADRFLEVIDVAARAVRLEVTLPWYMEVAKFYGEEISTDASQVRPQHLGPNAAMVFFQVLRACDASLIHGDDRIRLRATWSTPFEREAMEVEMDTTLNALAGEDSHIEKAAVIAGFAEALQLADQALSPAEAQEYLDSALHHIINAPGAGTDPDLIEVESLLRSYLTRFGGTTL